MAVMAASPIPVISRAKKSPTGSHAKAFSNEKTLNQATEKIRPRFRPTRSANQPPLAAPANIPKNVPEVIRLIVSMEMPHWARTAGAA